MKILKLIWNKKDLRNRVLFTILILFGIQMAGGIPTPGVNTDYFKQLVSSNGSMSLINLFSGGGLGHLSITMLSVGPYITASIILQLMTIVFKSLEEIQKDGEVGQQKMKRYTIILGAALAFMESIGFAIGFGKQGLLISYKWYWVLCVTMIWTVVAFIITLLGELIEKKGIGQGISLILLFNILSSYPSDAMVLYHKFLEKQTVGNTVLHLAVILIFLTALFAFTIYIQECEKRIPVSYSQKLQGKVMKGTSYFPIKLIPGTVVPIIFASSLMTMPTLISTIFGNNSKNWFLNMLNNMNWFDSDHPSYSIGVIIYVALIFGFSYFYTNLIINPLDVANNFKKSGGMIHGIRPGKPTSDYIENQMKYTIALGAIALSVIALVPCVLSGMFGLNRLAFAGTSIIITVGVLLDTRDKIMAEVQTEMHYTTVNSRKGIF